MWGVTHGKWPWGGGVHTGGGWWEGAALGVAVASMWGVAVAQGVHSRLTPHAPIKVSHRGPSLKTLGSAFLTLLWPHELRSGKWLLYPLHMELTAPPGRGVPCSPPANPLGLALV